MPLACEKVCYTYRDGAGLSVPALTDADLTVEAGEFVGVMGRSGCGKSTLLQLAAGLLRPAAGRVRLEGRDIHDRAFDRKILRRRVGIVFQYPENQLFETTVARDVAFGLRHSGLTRDETRERVRRALEAVGLPAEEAAEKSPFALSEGQRRLAAVAGVLAAEPGYLLLDEPLAGLDPYHRQALLRMLERLCRQGTAVVLVSHDADALAEHAGRIVVMENGRILADGTPRAVFADIDSLRRHGLGVSTPRRLVDMLRRRGVPVAQDVVTERAFYAAVSNCGEGGDAR